MFCPAATIARIEEACLKNLPADRNRIKLRTLIRGGNGPKCPMK